MKVWSNLKTSEEVEWHFGWLVDIPPEFFQVIFKDCDLVICEQSPPALFETLTHSTIVVLPRRAAAYSRLAEDWHQALSECFPCREDRFDPQKIEQDQQQALGKLPDSPAKQEYQSKLQTMNEDFRDSIHSGYQGTYLRSRSARPQSTGSSQVCHAALIELLSPVEAGADFIPPEFRCFTPVLNSFTKFCETNLTEPYDRQKFNFEIEESP